MRRWSRSTATAPISAPPRSPPARRSRPAQGVRVLLFGPAAELGEPPAGVEVVDAPVSIAKAADPVSAARATPEASIVQAARAVARGPRAGAGVRRRHRRGAGGGHVQHQARARHLPPGARDPAAGARASPVTLLDVGANAEARREHLVQFAFMGAALARTRARRRAPARRAALQRRGGRARAARWCSRPTPSCASARAAGDLGRVRVRRQRRGRRRRRRAPPT